MRGPGCRAYLSPMTPRTAVSSSHVNLSDGLNVVTGNGVHPAEGMVPGVPRVSWTMKTSRSATGNRVVGGAMGYACFPSDADGDAAAEAGAGAAAGAGGAGAGV